MISSCRLSLSRISLHLLEEYYFLNDASAISYLGHVIPAMITPNTNTNDSPAEIANAIPKP